MTDTEEGETFLSLCNTHVSDKRQDEGRSSEAMALALRLGGGMSHLSPFFGQWCPPGAIWSLLTTSALACPTVLLQKAVPTPGKGEGLSGQAQKFILLIGEDVRTHNSHTTIHQHEKENFPRTLIAQNIWGGFRGFVLGF